MTNKKCILCGAKFEYDFEIVFHECDQDKNKNAE